MNGRERLITTLRGQQADRIPISPMINYNNIYEMFDYKPEIDSWFDPDDFDAMHKFVEYCDFFGFDVLHSRGTLWDSHVPGSAENWDVTVAHQGEGDNRQTTTTVRTPGGDLRQTMNYRRSSTFLIVYAIDEYLIKSKEDFELFAKYVPPAEHMDCGLISRAREAVGDKGLVAPCVHGAFNTINAFRKLDVMLMDPVLDEGFYREMITFFVKWIIPLFRRAIDAGADAIELGGNLATSAVGPDFFRDFVLDYENQLAKEIHNVGAFVLYHNCGDAATIMHLYNELHIDVWGYLTPPPFGDVDLHEALRVIRPDMSLRGNIDQVEFLVKATPEEIAARVKELLFKVKSRGNWILSTSDFFFDGAPYENIKAFAEAGLQYGRY